MINKSLACIQTFLEFICYIFNKFFLVFYIYVYCGRDNYRYFELPEYQKNIKDYFIYISYIKDGEYDIGKNESFQLQFLGVDKQGKTYQ